MSKKSKAKKAAANAPTTQDTPVIGRLYWYTPGRAPGEEATQERWKCRVVNHTTSSIVPGQEAVEVESATGNYWTAVVPISRISEA